ncbi:MAG: hypothetical protein OEX11_04660 [Nitrosomonas sp.]|nr:hypothetical protein [Nitrosomonas sp.]
MLCPKCGTENTDQAELCINCKESLSGEELLTSTKDTNEKPIASVANESAVEPNHHQRITGIDFQSDVDVINDKPVVSSGLNIFIIIGTLILPIIGVIMGFTYLRKDHPEAKKAGKSWLILGGIMILVNIILINMTK